MVSGNFKLTPEDPKFPVPFKPGTGSEINFFCDNSYQDATHNIVAAPLQSLRVAVIDEDGSVQGKPATILVGRDPKNGLKPITVTFPNAKTACSVSITPGPNGPSDQRIGFWVS